MPSSYLSHLPPAFRDSPTADSILEAIEGLFTDSRRSRDDSEPAFEERLDNLGRWFRPVGPTDQRIPDDRGDFLPWLARLLSVGLRADWDDETKRRVLSEAVSLYRQRGTKSGLQRLLMLHLSTGDLAEPLSRTTNSTALFEYQPDAPVRILDSPQDFGFDPPPHYFAVEIELPHSAPARIRRDQKIAIAVIEAEKPAHTVYGLRLSFPTLRLGSWILGSENSVLGTRVLGNDN